MTLGPRVFAASLALLAAGASLPGCATTWAASHFTANRPPIAENEREQDVPLPGTTETLTVTLHLLGVPLPASAQAASSGGTTAAAAAASENPMRFGCEVVQRSRSKVYRAATYYGKSWKRYAALAFALEGLIGGGMLALALTSKEPQDPEMAGDTVVPILIGGWLALDAVGSGILIFAPRRDVYEQSEREDVLPVRLDCPQGLLLEVDGRTLPIDALGNVGALGQALIERHIVETPAEPASSLRVHAAGAVGELYITPAHRCRWAQARQHSAATALCPAEGIYGQTPELIQAVLDVPVGALSGPEPLPEATESGE